MHASSFVATELKLLLLQPSFGKSIISAENLNKTDSVHWQDMLIAIVDNLRKDFNLSAVWMGDRMNRNRFLKQFENKASDFDTQMYARNYWHDPRCRGDPVIYVCCLFGKLIPTGQIDSFWVVPYSSRSFILFQYRQIVKLSVLQIRGRKHCM